MALTNADRQRRHRQRVKERLTAVSAPSALPAGGAMVNVADRAFVTAIEAVAASLQNLSTQPDGATSAATAADLSKTLRTLLDDRLVGGTEADWRDLMRLLYAQPTEEDERQALTIRRAWLRNPRGRRHFEAWLKQR